MNRKFNSRRARFVLTNAIVVFAVAFSLFAVQPIQARPNTEGETMRYVSMLGLDDSNDCATLESPCLTINHAISQSVAGDTIKVAVGIYTAASGNEVVLINKSITLSGGWDEVFVTQEGMSTIDGEDTKRGIDLSVAVTVLVEYFTIQNGFTSSYGGGIQNYAGTLTLNNIIVKNNSTESDENNGGGIYNQGALTINNSTISGNSGNGIYNYGSGNIVTLNNSTISGHIWGAGVRISNGVVVLNNSTITNNQYGIDMSYIWGYMFMQNTIIAGNTMIDCYNSPGGLITSYGYNLIGNLINCSFAPTTEDLVGNNTNPIDPRLTFLQDNGGPTFTHALYSTSPAVNRGNPAEPGSGGNACLSTDQRGIARPQGSRCSIGAYEGSIPAVTPLTKSPQGIILDSTPTFKWSKINGATEYRFQLRKGNRPIYTVYTKTLSASKCSATVCSSTPTTILSFNNNYKWRVQAKINGEWKSYSPYKTFKLFPAKPGLWKNQWNQLYVTNTTPKVDDFAIYAYINGCGTYKITYTPAVPIKNKKFAFTGSFYANGTFNTPTTVQGLLGLNYHHIPGCGYISGGPFSWSASWYSKNQPPAMSGEGGTTPFPIIPELETPFDLFEIEPEK